MTDFPYHLTPDDAALKRLGLIVLQVDETVEDDLRRLLPATAARLHITRIPSGAELTPETIAQMQHDLSHAAQLLPDAPFDVIGYACTSGATLIGPDRITAQVRAGRAAAHVTSPLTAAFAAIRAVDAKSVAIVSPYIAPVAQPICEAFTAQGLDVTASLSFGEKVERNVARIDAASIRAAALKVATSNPDCIFLSCTNLRTLDIIADLERDTGCTVLSSNQVLGWHMARLAQITVSGNAAERLFQTT